MPLSQDCPQGTVQAGGSPHIPSSDKGWACGEISQDALAAGPAWFLAAAVAVAVAAAEISGRGGWLHSNVAAAMIRFPLGWAPGPTARGVAPADRCPTWSPVCARGQAGCWGARLC